MADTKITALSALTAADPANDVLPIVDVNDPFMAASGTTKKISINNILGASGTATLASATITGDLTVDTSTLKVDSANNRVGIVQATPLYPLDVTGTVNGTAVAARLAYGVGGSVYSAFRFENTSFSGGNSEIRNYVNGATGTGSDLAFFTTQTGGSTLTERYRLDVSGVATWSNVGGVAGTAMTLNSTGLGVGATPSTYKLEIGNGGSDTRALFNPNNAFAIGVKNGANQLGGWIGSAGNNILTFSGNDGTMKVTIDSSGNVGVGVTPSAWGAGFKSLQVGSRLVLTVTGSDTFVGNNFYNDGSYKFINADYATYYDQTTGKHVWGTSTTSGAVNGVITWNPAMTLDASGNLLVGKTAVGSTTVGFQIEPAGGAVSTRSESTDATITWYAYSTGAAAARFYVGMGGTVFATNTTISAISDARFKENVQDIDVGLGAILALKPRKFDWKEGKGKNIKGDRGFIAQEFEQVFPQLVDKWNDPAPEGEAPYKSVRQDLIPVLVKAIQELAAEVNALKNA
jgi:hypothetical protein